jgi:hypothetical protein
MKTGTSGKYSALGYAQEQLRLAVHSLATSTESLPRRLAGVYVSNLMHAIQEMHHQGAGSLPFSIAEGLRGIERMMKAIDIKDDKGLEGSIEGQVYEQQAYEMIWLVVELDHVAQGEYFD